MAVIVRNETAAELPGIGPVFFEPLARAGEYFREHYGRTHCQRFRFEVAGREYWGEIVRTFDRSAPQGSRVSVDVELRTRFAGSTHSRALPETAKADWRGELRRAFKRNLESFLAEAEAAADAKATRHVERFQGATKAGAIAGAAMNGDAAAQEVIAAQEEREEPATGAAPAPVRRDNVEYHAGRDAWRANQAKDSNPYPAGGERAARWNLGWQEACDNAEPIARVIDATPTWRAVLPMLRAAIENGTAEDRRIAWGELERMAEAADNWNASAKA